MAHPDDGRPTIDREAVYFEAVKELHRRLTRKVVDLDKAGKVVFPNSLVARMLGSESLSRYDRGVYFDIQTPQGLYRFVPSQKSRLPDEEGGSVEIELYNSATIAPTDAGSERDFAPILRTESFVIGWNFDTDPGTRDAYVVDRDHAGETQFYPGGSTDFTVLTRFERILQPLMDLETPPAPEQFPSDFR